MNRRYDGSLIVMARDRGHAEVARLLEEARNRGGRVLAGSDSHPIHAAVTRDGAGEVLARETGCGLERWQA